MSWLILLVALEATDPVPEFWTVSSGDTCSNIALRVFGDGRAWSRIHQWNEMGPPPHVLRPGQVLRLRPPPPPPVALGPEARLTFVQPTVRARHLSQWSIGVLDAELFRLDEVNTLAGAAAELTFRDLSQLFLSERSLLVIGSDAVHSQLEAESLALADGELRMTLAAMRRIRTPGAETRIAAPQGPAQGVLSVDGSRLARLSLFDGDAEVRAQHTSVRVPAGHGTRVRDGLAPEPTRRLPLAPALDGVSLAALWAPGGAKAQLTWSTAERAAEYRVELARNQQFTDLLLDQRTKLTSSEFAGLEPGRVWARVTSMDEAGLQSRPSAAFVIDVVRLNGQAHDGATWLHRGDEVHVDGPQGAEVLLDGAPPVPLTAGLHDLVILRQGEVVLKTLLAVPPEPPRLRRTEEGIELVFSEEVRPDSPLELRCDDHPVPLTSTGRTWAAPDVHGTCSVRWRGRELTQFHSR